jgi:hypothetical protein
LDLKHGILVMMAVHFADTILIFYRIDTSRMKIG